MASRNDTTAIVFPFDAFGGAGTGTGAELLGDALRELLNDNTQESRKIRGHVYDGQVKIDEHEFSDFSLFQDWKQNAIRSLQKAREKGRVLYFGGNHLSVLPVYELAAKTETCVIQFDAHLDIYQTHDVRKAPANGNFMLHAEGKLPDVINVGHRDLILTPKAISKTFTLAIPAEDCHRHPDHVLTTIVEQAQTHDRIWIDLDVDAFDPAFAPAVQNPLPFGLDPSFVLSTLSTLWETGKVVGLSISEFDPGRDVNDRTLHLLAWLIEWALLKWSE